MLVLGLLVLGEGPASTVWKTFLFCVKSLVILGNVLGPVLGPVLHQK